MDLCSVVTISMRNIDATKQIDQRTMVPKNMPFIAAANLRMRLEIKSKIIKLEMDEQLANIHSFVF